MSNIVPNIATGDGKSGPIILMQYLKILDMYRTGWREHITNCTIRYEY